MRTHRRCFLHLVAPLLALALSACAHAPDDPAGTTFVLVRHAEKAQDDPRDPSLNAAGQARAQRLAASLRAVGVVAVYASAYRRTQATAAPTAQAHGLAVTTYDAAHAADTFAAELRRAHARDTVLVVGHSNTVPALAAALCGCTVAPMREDEFDRRLTVRIDAAGTATLLQSRYGFDGDDSATAERP